MRCASIAAAAALMVVAGCKVGPNYKAPAMPAPPAYSDNGHNGDWVAATPADAADRGDWWAIYNDLELNDLEQRCAKSNQSLEAALHAYEQAHDLVNQTRAALFPTVSLGATVTSNRVSNNKPLRIPNASQNYGDFLIPLSVSWEPDLWGRIRRQIETTKANSQASAADLANLRLSLQGNLAVTYLQLHGIDLQISLLRTTIDAYTEALKLTEVRKRGGVASDSDVEQATTQLEQTRAQLIDLGVQRAQYEHAIAVLVGVAATDFQIAEKPLASLPPTIPTGVPSQLLQRRPDIAAAERRVAAANAQIGVAQAAFYPSITIGASGGIESSAISTLFNSDSGEWSAGPSASQILFDAGRRKAQVEIALAQRAQATSLYRQQVLSAFRDVEDQLSALRVLQDEAVVTDRAVTAAKKSTELSTIRYKRGLAQYLEVITNQAIELSNERTAASLAARRIVASAQLQMALGGGWDVAQLPKN